ncbi:polysaccharide deacetylase family protein [Fodinicurvata sp. EGI_FJ10296]|uniref:polysaccharide deacetylase family protein n=1 Tax=Fodinicurvata sp. EGI_FJ10296 TaxID=3231908 RepID=UPI003454CDEB
MTNTIRNRMFSSAFAASSPFGVMFHHFFDDRRHPRIEGALSVDEFDQILSNPGPFTFLPAADWLARLERGTLRSNEICITFDDALLSQYELAEPVLRHHDLTAFWFVYSSVFNGDVPMLEVYRYFRNVQYNNTSLFYSDYFSAATALFDLDIESIRELESAQHYLIDFSIYNKSDRLFRFVRDRALEPDQNDLIMQRLMAAHEFDPASVAQDLWLTNDHIRQLSNNGHIVGLHSYSHPTNLSSYSEEQQRDEYIQNAEHLTKVTGNVPNIMAHPSNSYSEVTIQILKDLNIKYGFRSNDNVKRPYNFELPRVDHKLFFTPS